MIPDEILKLYLGLLKKSVEFQYKGHEDYELILGRIDSDIPIVGSSVSIQKRDPNTGQIYTVNYKVHVHDDLGNRLSCLEDLGGMCTKGELVHKDYLFDCIKCHRKFCLRHVQFVDGDREKPLCNYDGFLGRKGCFYKFEHEFSLGISRLRKFDKEIMRLDAETALQQAASRRDEARLRREELALKMKELKNRRKSLSARPLLSLFSASPEIKCPACDFSPWGGHQVDCPRCGTAWKTSRGVVCPSCGHRVSSIRCYRCNTQINV